MKNKIAIMGTSLVLAAALSACGGGSDASPASNLTPYVGAWTQCDGQGQRDKITLSLQDDSTLKARYESDYFAAADCSGSPGATLFFDDTVMSTLKTAGVAGVSALFPDGMKRRVEAGLFEITQTAGVPKLISRGMGISRTTTNFGDPEICIEGVAGQTLCFKESAETLRARTDLGMLLLEGDVLYVLDDGDTTGDGAFEASPFKRSP